MSTAAALITAEQLLAMPDDGWRYELVDGELRRMSPPGYEHGRIAMNLAWRLAQHARSRKLGDVLAAETGFLVRSNPDRVRAPDVSFVATERVQLGRERPGYFRGAPDLAVEVVSPSDSYSELEEKVFQWLEAGARAVVVIDPRTRNVSLYRGRDDIRVLGPSDVLDLSFVVDGFSVTVAELFE